MLSRLATTALGRNGFGRPNRPMSWPTTSSSTASRHRVSASVIIAR
jgi:hypothetical protein